MSLELLIELAASELHPPSADYENIIRPVLTPLQLPSKNSISNELNSLTASNSSNNSTVSQNSSTNSTPNIVLSHLTLQGASETEQEDEDEDNIFKQKQERKIIKAEHHLEEDDEELKDSYNIHSDDALASESDSELETQDSQRKRYQSYANNNYRQIDDSDDEENEQDENSDVDFMDYDSSPSLSSNSTNSSSMFPFNNNNNNNNTSTNTERYNWLPPGIKFKPRPIELTNYSTSLASVVKRERPLPNRNPHQAATVSLKRPHHDPFQMNNNNSNESVVKKSKNLVSTVFVGLFFCVSGAFSTPQTEIKHLIESHGGALDTGLTRKISHLVTTAADMQAATYRCKMAIKYGTTVVTEQWIRESIEKGALAKNYVLRHGSHHSE